MLGWRDRKRPARTAAEAVLSLVVLGSGLACATGRDVRPEVAPASESDPEVAAARAWLKVLSTKNAESLIQITQLPFNFAETGKRKPKRCNIMVGDTGRLERLIGCLDAQAPKLLQELGHADASRVLPTDRTQLPTSMTEALGPPRPGEHLVHTRVGDEATSFELVLLLVPRESGSGTFVSALALDEVMPDIE
jgi:hypothetical protein